jgi:hypothetical protein
MTMRLESRWQVGDRGAVYEFRVKLSMRIRGVKISDSELGWETEQAVELFADELRNDYPWVGAVGLTGRSNGWLAITDAKGEATEDELSDINDRVDQARKDFETSIIESFGYEENGRSSAATGRDLEAAYYFHERKIADAKEELRRPGISPEYRSQLEQMIRESQSQMSWARAKLKKSGHDFTPNLGVRDLAVAIGSGGVSLPEILASIASALERRAEEIRKVPGSQVQVNALHNDARFLNQAVSRYKGQA